MNGENAYENTRRLNYAGWQFVPVCVTCGRYVKADATITMRGDYGPVEKPNATCTRRGRTQMLFEGCHEPE